jgi:hypothetical protein
MLAGAAVPATASGASPAPVSSAPPGPQGLQPCASSDLVLRQAGAAASGPPDTVFALKNAGSAACRISGGVGIRLFDAHGDPIALRVAPRNAMPMLLTLAPGEEASFAVAFVPQKTAQCTTSARLEAYLAPQTTPVAANVAVPVCTGTTVHVSNLRAGVPVSAPTSSPAAFSP